MDKPPRGDLRGDSFREGVAGQFGHQVMQVQAEPAEPPPADDIMEEGIGVISQGRNPYACKFSRPGSFGRIEQPANGPSQLCRNEGFHNNFPDPQAVGLVQAARFGVAGAAQDGDLLT